MPLPRLAWNAYLAYHLPGQARFPFSPLKIIEHRQSRRVRRMVSHAYHTVPYYRRALDRLGLRPSDFQCAEDLAKLPLLERKQLQRDPASFVSTVHSLNRCLRLRTGGA